MSTTLGKRGLEEVSKVSKVTSVESLGPDRPQKLIRTVSSRGVPPVVPSPTEEETIRDIQHYKELLMKASQASVQADDSNQESVCEDMLEGLKKLHTVAGVTKTVLKITMVGKAVTEAASKFKDPSIRKTAKALVDKWKTEINAKVSRPTSTAKAFISVNPMPRVDLAGDAGCQKGTATPAPTPEVEQKDISSILAVSYSGEAKRDKIRDVLFKCLRPRLYEKEMEPAEMAVLIEESCYSQLEAKEYSAQIRSIRYNLTDPSNKDFKRRVLAGKYESELFAKLTAEEMMSANKAQQMTELRNYSLQECQSDWALRNGAIQESGMFTCGKCKKNRTTYFQMQTRSADEPMTTFVTCLNCGNKWKFC